MQINHRKIFSAFLPLLLITGACSSDEPAVGSSNKYGDDGNVTIEWTPQPDTIRPASYMVLNEDWYGHQNGTVNRFWDDGSITYRAFRKANPDGKQLGITSQYGMSFAGRYFFMSKQGNRFVVADDGLRCLASFRTLGNADAASGGDGRACVGVNSHKVYVGSSNKIHVFDLDRMAFTGIVSGYAGSNELYDNQTGDMVCIGDRVFACLQGAGIAVIDTSSDTIEKIIAPEAYGGVAVSHNGWVWVAGNPVSAYDPYTLEKVFSFDEGLLTHGGGAGWGAWHSCSLFASPSSNVVYWWTKNGDLGGGGCAGEMVRYDIDSGELKRLTSGSSYALFRCQPITEYLAGVGTLYDNNMSAVKSWRIRGGYPNSDGSVEDEREEYPWWFPTLPLFEDNNPPAIIASTITVKRGNKSKICLSDLFVDYDNPPRAASKQASLSPAEGISWSVASDTLYIDTSTAKTTVNTSLSLAVCSNGINASAYIPLTVK